MKSFHVGKAFELCCFVAGMLVVSVFQSEAGLCGGGQTLCGFR